MDSSPKKGRAYQGDICLQDRRGMDNLIVQWVAFLVGKTRMQGTEEGYLP